MRSRLEERIEGLTGAKLPETVGITPVEDTDSVRKAVVEVCVRAFLPAVVESGRWKDDPAQGIRDDLNACVDWSTSRIAVDNGRFVGCYLLSSPGKVNVAASHLKGLGIEGVALVVLESHRGRGIGRLLRAIPEAMGFDFVVGTHLKALGNLDRWLRHRHLIGEDGDMWITAREFSRSRGVDATV